MKKIIIVNILLLAACTTQNTTLPELPTIKPATQTTASVTPDPTPKIQAKLPGEKVIPKRTHAFQTFNNCGPATYSMLLSYSGITRDQKSLGQILRPYQNPQGDNDDKSVTMYELSQYTKNELQLPVYYRPNGTLDLLKRFVAADHPVVLRTWLNDKEDIGHFILVRGYNDATGKFIVDDSYYGPDREYAYETVEKRWQPFGYEYMVIGTPEDKNTLERILHAEVDEKVAWQNTVKRAQEETQQAPQNQFPVFNQSIAYYELDDYQKAIETFESIQTKIPRRMLWYQIQPIKAYQKVKNKQKVFELTDKILNDHNRAFSELYVIRAQTYIDEGNTDAAKKELELAIKYNENYQEAKELLKSI
jgi:tetratricopeptide (TPR) repeat protein